MKNEIIINPGFAVEGNPDVELKRNMAHYFEAVAIGQKGYFAR